MAVGSLQSNALGPRPAFFRPGGSFPMFNGPEGATQTFVLGAPLIWSSGTLIIGTADMTAGLVGFAAKAASGTTNANMPYWSAMPGCVYEITLEDQTNEDHALVAGDLGGVFALRVDDDGVWYLDENDTTNVAMRIVSFGRSEATDVRARVFAEVLSDVWDGGT